MLHRLHKITVPACFVLLVLLVLLVLNDASMCVSQVAVAALVALLLVVLVPDCLRDFKMGVNQIFSLGGAPILGLFLQKVVPASFVMVLWLEPSAAAVAFVCAAPQAIRMAFV